MQKQILDYIKSQRIAVLGMQKLDGGPHSATIHFGHIEDPLRFIILTSKASKKCEALVANGKCKASLVLGTSEEDMKTMQLEGDVEFTEDATILDAYFAKFPEKWDKYSPGGHDAFLLFTPTWWRYSDYKADGQKIFSSEE